MRKLPEAGSQLIREFKKENGAFVAFRVAGLAPDDDSFERHSAEPQSGMHMHHGNGQLRPEGKFPAAREPHSALGDLHLSVNTQLDFRFIVQGNRAGGG
jgi:hypothetical protein